MKFNYYQGIFSLNEEIYFLFFLHRIKISFDNFKNTLLTSHS